MEQKSTIITRSGNDETDNYYINPNLLYAHAYPMLKTSFRFVKFSVTFLFLQC